VETTIHLECAEIVPPVSMTGRSSSRTPHDHLDGRRCALEGIVANINLMETYRIVPLRRAYRVEAVLPDGQKRVVRTWPTEEAAVSHLKALREIAERTVPVLHPGEKDWRG
jgi:hypothetical protein